MEEDDYKKMKALQKAVLINPNPNPQISDKNKQSNEQFFKGANF